VRHLFASPGTFQIPPDYSFGCKSLLYSRGQILGVPPASLIHNSDITWLVHGTPAFPSELSMWTTRANFPTSEGLQGYAKNLRAPLSGSVRALIFIGHFPANENQGWLSSDTSIGKQIIVVFGSAPFEAYACARSHLNDLVTRPPLFKCAVRNRWEARTSA